MVTVCFATWSLAGYTRGLAFGCITQLHIKLQILFVPVSKAIILALTDNDTQNWLNILS